MAPREILKHIVLAKVASEAGKGKYTLSLKGDTKAKSAGYGMKAYYQREAMKMIDSCKKSPGVSYWTRDTIDQNGIPCTVVCFNIRPGIVSGEPIQILFHNPRGRDRILDPYVNKGKKTRILGTPGITSCQLIIDKMNLNTRR